MRTRPQLAPAQRLSAGGIDIRANGVGGSGLIERLRFSRVGPKRQPSATLAAAVVGESGGTCRPPSSAARSRSTASRGLARSAQRAWRLSARLPLSCRSSADITLCGRDRLVLDEAWFDHTCVVAHPGLDPLRLNECRLSGSILCRSTRKILDHTFFGDRTAEFR